MPNFVKVDSKPFHPDTYIGPEGEDEDAQAAETAREKSMTIKLKVENTVRWRWVKDENGQDRRQSNARIVRWSDGTLSLLLGKELFDITQTIDTSGAVPRKAFGPGTQSQPSSQSQSQSQGATAGPSKSQGLTYLVAQHKRAEILQSEALVTGYMSLRPTGMQSSTHRMLVRAVGQKHTKVARLRMAPDPVMDPEREKMELMKAASRKPRRPRGEGDEGFGTRRRRSGYTRRRTGEEMWSDEEEEEDAGYGGGASEDEYGGDLSAKKRRKSEKEDAKKGPGEYQTDDFLVADSDEDADAYGSDEGGATRKRSKRHREERDADEDELERMEKQMEEERRRRKEGGATEEDAEEDGMDVESEEEDEGGAVRKRTTGGSRKKRVIEMEEEEEEE
ncbi:hypothetical protein FOMPIDRAFT_1161082 [Fomitopsis schrenkii]|uniref:Leo1-like protein n=1 Tax=Fomitopsis schrenkii TaxID=2126942 RepID=S8FUF6_FOMSC|nr:hypothetical protein FOMPIDRAFT_1161082 [Fomitopsis schrenkii]